MYRMHLLHRADSARVSKSHLHVGVRPRPSIGLALAVLGDLLLLRPRFVRLEPRHVLVVCLSIDRFYARTQGGTDRSQQGQGHQR